MAKKEINSIFEVTVFRTGQRSEIIVSGSGQETVKFVRKQYPRHSKIVLVGHEIDGNFVQLRLPANYDRQ